MKLSQPQKLSRLHIALFRTRSDKSCLQQVFELLLRLYNRNPEPDWTSITTIWVQHDDYTSCANALAKLLREQSILDAYQIAFDLNEMAAQSFVEGVRKKLAEEELGPSEGIVSASLPRRKAEQALQASDEPRRILDDILRGDKSAELQLNFLAKSNKTDAAILKVTKVGLNSLKRRCETDVW